MIFIYLITEFTNKTFYEMKGETYLNGSTMISNAFFTSPFVSNLNTLFK